MKKKNQKNKLKYYLLTIIGLIVIVFFFFSIKYIGIHQTINPSSSQSKDIVPIISSANVEGWKIFTYPDPKRKFSFEFPSNWEVKMGKVLNNFPVITFKYQEISKEYTFTINSDHAAEYYGPDFSYVDETKSYAGRQTNIKTLSKNGQEFELVASFGDFDPNRDAVQVINMDLPTTNKEKYLVIFDQILSSFKFYH